MTKKKKTKSKPHQPAVRPLAPAAEKGYPSPAERELIIARRNELFTKLIPILLTGSPDEPDKRFSRLTQKYGPEEVVLVLDKFRKMTQTRELIGEEALLYRECRRTFARFGGERPFLNKKEYEALVLEHGMLLGKRKLKGWLPFLNRRSDRERELYELLLLQVDYWEDITPPAVPPRPADFVAPAPGHYQQGQEVLTWGPPEHEHQIAAKLKKAKQWRPALPELVQMVFDEGLLEGWPGGAASWAPYYALLLLGRLEAHEQAGQLFALLDRENDWLSDRLSVVWREMGPPAEEALWSYVRDSSHDPEKRAVGLKGLEGMAQAHRYRRADIIKGLSQLLRDASVEDARANGYIVHILARMGAVESKEILRDAFAQGKVDPKIMQPVDVDFLDEEE